jgi:hypothetical protein
VLQGLVPFFFLVAFAVGCGFVFIVAALAVLASSSRFDIPKAFPTVCAKASVLSVEGYRLILLILSPWNNMKLYPLKLYHPLYVLVNTFC